MNYEGKELYLLQIPNGIDRKRLKLLHNRNLESIRGIEAEIVSLGEGSGSSNNSLSVFRKDGAQVVLTQWKIAEQLVFSSQSVQQTQQQQPKESGTPAFRDPNAVTVSRMVVPSQMPTFEFKDPESPQQPMAILSRYRGDVDEGASSPGHIKIEEVSSPSHDNRIEKGSGRRKHKRDKGDGDDTERRRRKRKV